MSLLWNGFETWPKKEEEKKEMIVIDSREASRNKWVLKALADQKPKIEYLEAGDFLIGDILIERKTPTDLAFSIKSGRLWRELEKLKLAENVKPLLLIEGSLSLVEKFTKWNPTSILGVILSIIIDFKIPIITVPSKKWTIILLSNLVKYMTANKKKTRPLRVKQKARTPQDYMRMVVEGLPGVSGVRAIALLEHFKTLKGLFSASVEDLVEVEGVGEKTAEKLWKIMNMKYEGK